MGGRLERFSSLVTPAQVLGVLPIWRDLLPLLYSLTGKGAGVNSICISGESRLPSPKATWIPAWLSARALIPAVKNLQIVKKMAGRHIFDGQPRSRNRALFAARKPWEPSQRPMLSFPNEVGKDKIVGSPNYSSCTISKSISPSNILGHPIPPEHLVVHSQVYQFNLPRCFHGCTARLSVEHTDWHNITSLFLCGLPTDKGGSCTFICEYTVLIFAVIFSPREAIVDVSKLLQNSTSLELEKYEKRIGMWLSNLVCFLKSHMIPQFHFLLRIRTMNWILSRLRCFRFLNATRIKTNQRSHGKSSLTGKGLLRPVWAWNGQHSCLPERHISLLGDGVNQESQNMTSVLVETEFGTSGELKDSRVGEFV